MNSISIIEPLTRGQIIDMAIVAINEALEFGKVTQSDLEKLESAIKLGGINPPANKRSRTWGYYVRTLKGFNKSDTNRETIEAGIASAKDEAAQAAWMRKSTYARFILTAVREALWHSHLTQTRFHGILAGAIAKNCASGMDESDATRKAVEWVFWIIDKEAESGKLGEADEADLLSSLQVVAIVACTKKVGMDYARGYRMAIAFLQSLERKTKIQTAA